MIQDDAGGTLARSFIATMSNPDQFQELYGILGEFCHLFRNRLNSLKLSLYLAKREGPLMRPESWDALDREYRRAEQFMEQLQMVYRPTPLSSVRLPLGMLLDDRCPVWNEWLSCRGRRVELSGPRDPAVGDFDPSRLGQGLDALAAWRSEAGEPGTSITLRWRAERDQLQMEWKEFATTTATSTSCPSSLALPLLARVMADHGGSMSVAPGSGLRLRLSWPLQAKRA